MKNTQDSKTAENAEHYELSDFDLEKSEVMREPMKVVPKYRGKLKWTGSLDEMRTEFISVTYAQKKYLGWRDRDILANREFLRKDAEMQWELAQIQAAGPMWKEQLAASSGAEAEIGGEGGGVAGGGEGGIPEFGGGPASTGDEAAGDAGAEEFDAAVEPGPDAGADT